MVWSLIDSDVCQGSKSVNQEEEDLQNPAKSLRLVVYNDQGYYQI